MSDKFIKDYPSLIPFICNQKEWKKEDAIVLSMQQINKCFIDKQKVKEVIEKFKSRSENKWTDVRVEEFLKQELKL